MISYKYKLYTTKQSKHLQATLAEACYAWNHCLALQKRYYWMYNKYINKYRLIKHMTKVWNRRYIGSQSLQEIVERLDAAYMRFFKHDAKRPPKFKKASYFSSFVFKQCGYKSCDGHRVIINIGGKKHQYKFSKSRDFGGKPKTVRIKRTRLGEYFIVIATDAVARKYGKSHNGASIGMDFGLKIYLTLSNAEKISNPQFLKKSLKQLRKAQRHMSRCKEGSNNREKARLVVDRIYEKISNRRMDFQWKLAHELCRRFDYIFIEDLNLQGMSRMWGRKMHDLAHGHFILILQQTAAKYRCTVHKIDRYYPSSRLCPCGYKNDMLTLKDRSWVCPHCGQVHDRDILAAQNIHREGIHDLESSHKTIPTREWQTAFDSRIPCL